VAEVAESQDVEARSVEGEVVEVNGANFLKKIKRKKINRCLYHNALISVELMVLNE
jgi:hypothetical protein